MVDAYALTHPRLVWNREGPWAIFANAAGDCVAIPKDAGSGHKVSHFGTLGHVARLKQRQGRTRLSQVVV